MNFSVTKNGISLNNHLYAWDERTRTFSTEENFLVLDFRRMHEVKFKTGSFCTFTTGSFCKFITGSDCVFKTGSNCVFKTGSNCTFKTGFHCTFDTGSGCTFDTGSNCTFDTIYNCKFITGSSCIFKTRKNCVIIRHDIYEVIKLSKRFNHIKLNKYYVSGYTEVLPEVNEELNSFYLTEKDFGIE